MKSKFLDKLIGRLDKLDPESLQTQFLRLIQERGWLETVFQSIQEGVIVIDEDGCINYTNSAAEHLMGFTGKTTKGKKISRYLTDIDWDRVLSLDTSEWSKLISSEIEITYPEHKFINFYIVPLVPGEGDEKGAVVILRDVTPDRRNEESMLESERLNAVKLLAAGVAHEIGNPLNALNIHLQLLDREIKTLAEDDELLKAEDPASSKGSAAARKRQKTEEMENLSELVDVARNEVSRLDVIITQFLRAIRPTKPKFVASRVEEVLKETLTLLKQEVQNRSVKVEIDARGTIPEIPLDRNQIKQAFFNLIKNAFQAMPDGGKLTITLSCSDQFLGISFRDTGVGIKPEDFGHIFEPYHTSKKSGSGLGLMIVQRIIQDHGGQIELVSKPESGTNFTIMLPLAERRVRLLKAPKKK